MNLWAIFLTGLTTGGLSCLAMQGGLLASTIANQKEAEIDTKKSTTRTGSFDQLDWLPVVLFLVSKLIAHTILGFFLGWLGSKIELGLTVRLVFQTLAALFMLATAGNLLDLHPLFRYVVFQPPKFLQKLVRNTTKSKALFTPALLGLLTIFIPCGVTQAMEVLAITSGSPVYGAATMFAFVLGTSPLFAAVGVATAKLSEAFQQQFMKLAAALLIFLSLSSLNGILVVIDFPITWQKMTEPISYFFSDQRFSNQGSSKPEVALVDQTGDVQKVTIQALGNGYSPRRFAVKAGKPVELTVATNNTYSCASYFSFKQFGINFQLGPDDIQTVTFTPNNPGTYQFSCSMGMYTGVMEVI
jgi:sulfite exporter TauE/SafE